MTQARPNETTDTPAAFHANLTVLSHPALNSQKGKLSVYTANHRRIRMLIVDTVCSLTQVLSLRRLCYLVHLVSMAHLGLAVQTLERRTHLRGSKKPVLTATLGSPSTPYSSLVPACLGSRRVPCWVLLKSFETRKNFVPPPMPISPPISTQLFHWDVDNVPCNRSPNSRYGYSPPPHQTNRCTQWHTQVFSFYPSLAHADATVYTVPDMLINSTFCHISPTFTLDFYVRNYLCTLAGSIYGYNSGIIGGLSG